jgi:hypothetical protein
MNTKELSPADLCRRFAEGWTADRAEIPRELFGRLIAGWHAAPGREWIGRSAFRRVIEASHVRLQGACEIGCLLLGGGADVAKEVAAYWDDLGGAGRIGLIFAATPALAQAARAVCPQERCAFFANGEIEEVLLHHRPLDGLKEYLRANIPRGRLLPYDITHPVRPNMFFGRQDLVTRFINEETTSFAVAGPGRIGKSSLLRQYIHCLRKKGDERVGRLKLIDCFAYSHLDPDGLARRIALDLSAESEANRVNMETLQRFLKRLSHDGRQPLELLFDEVDLVCRNHAFERLGEAVKEGYCRLILCGKGGLHKMMRSKDWILAARLELIQPEPLDPISAERLLMEPLADLGLKVEHPEAVRDGVFSLTRRLPNLIQACAKQMVEHALAEGSETLTLAHLRRVSEESGTVFYGVLPFEDLTDDLTRLITLLILRAGCGVVNVGRLLQLADRENVELNAEKALEICYELWICNVLTHERGVFTLANPTLVDFVQKLGLLPGEIARLLRIVPRTQPRRPGFLF